MFASFSFDATARGFAGAFFFGDMATRVLRRENWMGAEDGAVGGRGEIWGKLVEIGVVWMIGGAHALNSDVAEAPVRPFDAPRKVAGIGLSAVLVGSKRWRCILDVPTSTNLKPAHKWLSRTLLVS
jgi:hypothetical protein